MIETSRFGRFEISQGDVIQFPQGILGFPELTEYCVVDPGDDTLILWLQAIKNPEIAFAVLEPRFFKTDYKVRLSGAELRDLKLQTVNHAAVLCVLTIPKEVREMTANIKAPLVINLDDQVAKQVVLQENEYSLQFPMFKELRAHLMTMQSGKNSTTAGDAAPSSHAVLPVRQITPSTMVV